MRMRKIRIYSQNMRIIRIYSQNCTYLYIIELYLCIISYYIAIISQINANFMRIFIIRMRMRNFVSMRISHSSKKCYEISHILARSVWPRSLKLEKTTTSQNQKIAVTSNDFIAGNGRVLKVYVFIMWLNRFAKLVHLISFFFHCIILLLLLLVIY